MACWTAACWTAACWTAPGSSAPRRAQGTAARLPGRREAPPGGSGALGRLLDARGVARDGGRLRLRHRRPRLPPRRAAPLQRRELVLDLQRGRGEANARTHERKRAGEREREITREREGWREIERMGEREKGREKEREREIERENERERERERKREREKEREREREREPIQRRELLLDLQWARARVNRMTKRESERRTVERGEKREREIRPREWEREREREREREVRPSAAGSCSICGRSRYEKRGEMRGDRRKERGDEKRGEMRRERPSRGGGSSQILLHLRGVRGKGRLGNAGGGNEEGM